MELDAKKSKALINQWDAFILKNMKRVIILSVLLFTSLITLSACSKSPVATDNNNQNNTNTPGTKTPGTRGSRLPDFGQPDRPADIRGIVKSIIGNEAVILKVDMKGGRGQNASSTPDSNNASGARQAPAISLNGAGGNGGGQGRGGFGGGQGGPNGPGGQGGGTVDRTAMIDKLKAMSTGEETVIIPVGIKMLKSSTDSNSKQRTMVEASLSDVVSDKSITIWLNSAVTDKKVAEFVLIN